MESAKVAFEFVVAKFTGGHNKYANARWIQELKEGMRDDETFEDWVIRAQCLFENLIGTVISFRWMIW